MLTHVKDWTPVSKPSAEETQHLDNIISVLDFPRQDEKYLEWFKVVFFNLLKREAKKVLRKEVGRAKIALPKGQRFYSGEYLRERMALQGHIGKNKLTARLADDIRTHLTYIGIADEVIGYPQFKGYRRPGESLVEDGAGKVTVLYLRDYKLWSIRESASPSEKLRAYVSYLILIATSLKKNKHSTTAAVCRSKKEIGDGYLRVERPATKPLIDLVERINSYAPKGYEQLFEYTLIFGENEHSHGRLYSPFTNLERGKRDYLIEQLDYRESDISSCALNTLYIVETGDFFYDAEWGADIYSAILSKIAIHQDYIPRCRPLLKEIMTVAMGDNQSSSAVINGRIQRRLMEVGVVVDYPTEKKFLASWRKNIKRYGGVYDKDQAVAAFAKKKKKLVEAALVEKRRRWEYYCEQHGVEICAPPILTADMIMSAIQTYFPVVAKYFYKGGFTLTTSIETLANLALHQFALDRGIHIHTLHDAVYCHKDHAELIAQKQLEFLKEAAKTKMLIRSHKFIWAPLARLVIDWAKDATPEQREAVAEHPENILGELSEDKLVKLDFFVSRLIKVLGDPEEARTKITEFLDEILKKIFKKTQDGRRDRIRFTTLDFNSIISEAVLSKFSILSSSTSLYFNSLYYLYTITPEMGYTEKDVWDNYLEAPE